MINFWTKRIFRSAITVSVTSSALVLALLLVSCNEESSIGADFFEEESFEIFVVDSLTLEVSTVLFDSVETINDDRLLVGFHEDADFGKVLAIPFLQFNLGTPPTLDPDFTSFDSLTLVLRYDGYFFYDTSQIQTLSVNRLTEEFEADEDTGELYNHSIFEYSPTPLGTLSFRPRPQKQGELEIRLDDDLGIEILTKIIEEEEDVEDTEKFYEYLRGMALLPGTNVSRAILGFTSEAELRLHYTNNTDLPTTQETIIFSLGGSYFNHIQGDRTGTFIEALTDSVESLNTSLSNHEAYLQGGTATAVRVEIPNLKKMLEANESFIISGATLVIYPILDNLSEQPYLPSSLPVDWVDGDNEIFYSQSSASLNTDDEFGRDTNYELDVADFLNYQFALEELNENALLINLPAPLPYNSVTRLILGDAEHEKSMELKIYSIDIKEN